MQVNLQEKLDKAISIIDKRTNNTEEELREAEDIVNFLLSYDKDSQALWFYLGVIASKRKYNFLAIELFKKSLSLDSESIAATPVYNNLGVVYKEENLINESRDCFDKAIKIHDEKRKKNGKVKNLDEDLITNLGSLFVGMGEPDKAIELFDKALKINPKHTQAHWNKSLCLLEKGDYAKGWPEYDYGERLADRVERNYSIDNLPTWDGSPQKTVIVYGEQGIGDEIMFASMLPDLMKTCRVILDAHPRLVELFRESFPTIPVFGTRKVSTSYIQWQQFFNVDAKIPIGGLGKFFRNKKEDFPGAPYLKANDKLIAKYKEKLDSLGDKLKIGISWTGGIKSTNNSERHIPLEKWLPIFNQEVEIISLQYKKDAQSQIDKFNKEHPNIKIHHWQDAVDDYDETAALVSNLDLVISVPQSVVHLAGALGVGTWQLCPKKALWQMGPYGEDMPWYSSVHNFWQDETLTWEPVIQRVSEMLCNCILNSIDN